MKQKPVVFEKINEIDISHQTNQEERGNAQITNTMNESGDITIDPTDIKRIKKEQFHEQLCVNTFNNIEEVNKLLERHKLPLSIQEEVDNLNI